MTPYSVGRCHEVTEGTGDRWEQISPDKPVKPAQRRFTETAHPHPSACPTTGERPERNSPSRDSFTVNSDMIALPQREGENISATNIYHNNTKKDEPEKFVLLYYLLF